MTIKQQGGIFGRNPTFNDVDAVSVNATDVDATNVNTTNVDATGVVSGNFRVVGNAPAYQFSETDTTDQNWQIRVNGGELLFQSQTDAFNSAFTVMRITESGNLKGFNGFGIDFSATGDGSGTMDNELFDDYEEGSFTIGVTCGGTAESASNVYTEYTKVGNKVTVNARFSVASFSGTGTVSFALPYAVTSNASHYIVVPIGGNRLSHPGDTPAVSLTPGATSASLFGIINSTASSGASITDANFSSGTQVRASFTYLTD